MTKKLLFMALFALLTALACSTDNKPALKESAPYQLENLISFPCHVDSLLPGNIDSLSLALIEKSSLITPDSAKATFGAQGERYLQHLFIGQKSGTYLSGQDTLVLTISQFAEHPEAFGFYAKLRPITVGLLRIGAEGFISEPTLYFTKSYYVASISLKPVTASGAASREKLASVVAQKIYEPGKVPAYFVLFPYVGKILSTANYYPYRYLDVTGLNRVFVTSYAAESDTVELFLSMDESGEKFLWLKDYAEKSGKTTTDVKRFEFDPGYSIAFEFPGRGVLIAGLVKGKLVGAVGFNPKRNEHLISQWISGLNQ